VGLLLLFGLVERASAAQGIFREKSAPKSTFFATHFYHANAGVFINLTLPLVTGRAILAFRNKEGQLGVPSGASYCSSAKKKQAEPENGHRKQTLNEQKTFGHQRVQTYAQGA
jgi:hypothetical protein